MKTVYLFCFIFGIIGCSTSSCLAQCVLPSNVYSFTYAGKSYEIIKQKKTWNDAAACAVERGGYLAHIESDEEATALYNAIASAGISSTYTQVGDGGGIAYVWIGATDKFTEGTWVWAGNNSNSTLNFWNGQGLAGMNNGSAVNGKYNRWGGTSTGTRNEPDDFSSNQDAAAIALATWPSCVPTCMTPLGVAGEWNDIAVSNTLYSIVELGPIIPIEMVDFTAQATPKGVKLAWITATELNNKGFEIETSFDGSNWYSVGWVNGQGTISKKVNYSFLHQTSLNSSYYYRLKQIDFDGQVNYSKTISVVLEKSNVHIKIYPSVIQQDLVVESPSELKEIQITNSVGQVVFSKKIKSLRESINLSSLPSGVYFVTVVGINEMFSQKIVRL
jgi:hypothetical protein